MSQENPQVRTFCFACRLLRAEVGETIYNGPCPKCGNTTTVSYRPGEEFRITAGAIGMTSRPPEGGRWIAKSESTHSYFRKTGRNHYVHRVIDRDGNQYYERIVDVETGKVVREIEEPLTEHRGRGSARARKSW